MISSPNDRKKIRDALQEISYSMTRIEAERDLIKSIKDQIKEDFEDLEKKVISKMAKVYHKQTFNQETQDASEFEQLYNEVILLNTGPNSADPESVD